MGFLKNLVKAGGNLITGDLKGVVGAFGGGDGGKSNYEKARLQVNAAFYKPKLEGYMSSGMTLSAAMLKALQDLSAYMKTPEYTAAVTKIEGQLNAGQSAQGSTITGLANDAIKGVFDTATNAVGTAITNGVNTVAQNLGASSGAQSIKETLGDLLSGVGVAAGKSWLKKNWPYLVLPGGLVVYFIGRALGLFKSKGAKVGKTAKIRRA